jgi:hypothetical protein
MNKEAEARVEGPPPQSFARTGWSGLLYVPTLPLRRGTAA